MARMYLDKQRELWPELADSELLPSRTDDVLDRMVDEYKRQHRNGQVNAKAVMSKIGRRPNLLLATTYCRYSCDNSSPLSIIDQLYNALVKAHEERRFVPWEFVFADYSVSGLDSGRRGYGNCKSLIQSHRDVVDTMYIDECSRALRDSLEWWRLASVCQRAKLRMIGASDGFDLSSSDWDIKVTIYGLISRLFIRDLRVKVLRGMKGGARRHTVLGKLPIGFTRQHVRDACGELVRRPNGKPLCKPAVEPESASLVRNIFKLYSVKLWFAYRIAKFLNRMKSDGTDTWTESSVKKILRNPAYIGVFIWNRTRRVFDPETEMYSIVKNPKSEWVVHFDPEAAIISLETWRATQRRRSKSRRKKRNPTRNQLSATTLLSGTLHCGYCGKELTLCRSAGKYKNLFCTNGRVGVHGCQLTTTKSTRIIEQCVLSYIKDVLLTESALHELLDQANSHLAALAKRPTVDVTPIKSQAKELQTKIDRLVNRVADLPEDREEVRDGYERRIVKFQKELDGLRAQVRSAESQNTAPPPPISRDAVDLYLKDIREVFSLEIPQAAEAIRQLTGPIEVRQQKVEGKRGARWIAKFTPNIPQLLHYVSQRNDYPDSVTLEFLCHANWITPDSVEIPIEQIPKYEQLAPKMKEMQEQGKTIHEIASAHKIGWQVAYESLHFAETGERPKWYQADDPIRYQGWDHYQELAPLVARLRDQDKLDWAEVIVETRKQSGHQISAVTALRAYEYAHRQETRAAVGIGTAFAPRHGLEKFEQLQSLAESGITNGAELARRVGVSRNTANRWKKRLA